MIRPSFRRRSGSGFTLVELMVVIVIIGILIALLVPAIAGAVRKARDAQVSSEIQTLATSLAAFKEKYGDYPPSRILLSETGVYPTGDTNDISTLPTNYTVVGSFPTASAAVGADLTIAAVTERSLRYLWKFWPRANHQLPFPVGPAGDQYFPDYNGNGVQDSGLIYLQGHECLVFFLGGIPNPSGGGTFGMSGFAKDTLYPFKNALTTANNNQTTSNRYPPFHEFKGDRLIDDDGDGIPGFVDPLGTQSEARYYAYFSAYGNGFYDPNDCNASIPGSGAEVDSSGNPLGNTFTLNFPPGLTASPAPNPYTTSPSNPGAIGSANKSATYYNSTSYQIISAGGDRFYGAGGQYSPQGNDPLPDSTGGTLERVRERDNLTNFSTNRLD